MLTVIRSERFAEWLQGLRDRQAVTRIAARIRRIETTGNLGDFHSVGGEVSELRFFFGPGYRVYFTREGEDVIILLCGGDHDSQSRDIETAQRMVREREGR